MLSPYSNLIGIPYRRGYLLYGHPGTGKSSFIQALAGALNYNICIINLSESALTDDRLNHLLCHAPERSILLLEDIDAAFHNTREKRVGYSQCHVTFSGLLNALDGVAAAEERIIFMTTNHVERLDPALIRPGRVDVQKFIGLATDYQVKELFLKFFPDQEIAATEFMNACKGSKLSTAELQGHLIRCKSDPRLALSLIDDLVSKECAVEAE